MASVRTPTLLVVGAANIVVANGRAVVDALKAMDGVTSALELEVGTDDIDRWYAARAGKSLINYGASIGHIPSRIAVTKDPGEIADIAAHIEHGLERGAPAVGFGFAYTLRLRSIVFGEDTDSQGPNWP